MIGRGAGVVAAWLAMSVQAWGQPALPQPAPDQSDTLALGGVLLNAATGEPVRRAQLLLQFVSGPKPGPASLALASDAGGHFAVSGLAPGSYRLWAEHRGSPRQELRQQDGSPLVAGGEEITFRMEPFATLSGTVTDENGDAVAGAAIQLVRVTVESGRQQQRPGPTAVTNDRGEYRVTSAVPGRYYVSAYAGAQDADAAMFYPRRFFPGVSDLAGASVLMLEGGGRTRADFRLQPEPAFSIRGRVPGSAEIVGLTVSFVPREPAARFGASGYPVRLLGEGAFEIPGVAAGQYVLTAQGERHGVGEAAAQVVTVGTADLNGVTLPLSPLANVTGKVQVQAREGAPAIPLPQVAIALEPEDSITQPVLLAKLLEEGRFTITLARPGEYVPRINVPAPFFVKSAQAGGVDLLQEALRIPANGAPPPIEIQLGSKGGSVSGTVLAGTKPAARAIVLLQRGANENRFAVTDDQGKFAVEALAPGKIAAYAWADISGVEYRNPKALERYTGKNITVEEGGTATVELTRNSEP